MAYSRMSALACALPLVALVLASLCLNTSAELAVPEAASSALAAAMSGDLAQLDGGKKTPPTPTTPATPGKPATSGKPGTPGAGKPAVKLSGSDSKVVSLLDAAAVDVDSAKAKLSVKTYVKSLTDTAAALRNAAILIRTGQRTLVAGQIDNSIATINGVSIMLPAGGADKSLLASALGKAQSAKAAWKA
ncbi:unnamed protein product [Closterium sp. NIES-65]|nr:unnamed protein product [Closterium sp. NIES-65]